jgi:TrmH family RNA methyltransferase
MLSKNKLKLIQSLDKKKQRAETGLFLAEGNKLVADLLPYFDCVLLVARPAWMAMQGDLRVKELVVAEEGDIEKASLQQHPQDVIAVFAQPQQSLDKVSLREELSIVLDGVQDPGNLGTIVRLADWFGVKQVICSPDTADIYNPKAVQATMGGLAHVKVFYAPLPALFKEMWTIDAAFPIYGTFLDGDDIYKVSLRSKGFIVMGNEGNGIRSQVEALIDQRLYIPNYPPESETTESLNVGVATAIACAEFRRQQVYQ